METKKTNKLTGYFDVKEYNAKKPREQWKTKGNDEVISFGVIFKECPAEFEKYAKEYQNKDGEKRYAVKFKIGSKCRWFDKRAKNVERPTNDSLHNKRFECQLMYNQLDGDPSQKEASGYWVNAIQFSEYVENPFSSWVAYDEPEEKHEPESVADESANTDLPF